MLRFLENKTFFIQFSGKPKNFNYIFKTIKNSAFNQKEIQLLRKKERVNFKFLKYFDSILGEQNNFARMFRTPDSF